MQKLMGEIRDADKTELRSCQVRVDYYYAKLKRTGQF